MSELINNPEVEELDDDGQGPVVGADGAGTEDRQKQADGGDKGKSTGDAGRAPDYDYRKAVNSAARAARHTGEQLGREAANAEINAVIKAQGLINPYTSKLIESVEDYEAYGRAYRAEAENTDQEAIRRRDEDAKTAGRARKEAEEREKAKNEEEARRVFIAADLQAFVAQYPQADISKLDADARFRRFCGDRYGRVPLAELYGDWLELTSGAALAAEAKKQDKDKRGTGSGAGSESFVLTPAQKAELDEWNRDNPAMKMTPKEFLAR